MKCEARVPNNCGESFGQVEWRGQCDKHHLGRVGSHSVTRVYRMTAGKWKRRIQPDVNTDTDSDADTISEMDTNRN